MKTCVWSAASYPSVKFSVRTPSEGKKLLPLILDGELVTVSGLIPTPRRIQLISLLMSWLHSYEASGLIGQRDRGIVFRIGDTTGDQCGTFWNQVPVI